MPTLEWIGKSKVINHHQDVPFRVLEEKYTYNNSASENKIIHGDNLEALKALLPEYEGKINCIYIDPPYNTGEEKWVYNDNVNDPKIKKWLGEIVGKEGEDLSRHDKWLCMMYPRLRLLQQLLHPTDGVIIISIDDNEIADLKLICDEIFQNANHIATIVWQKRYSRENREAIGDVHEYLLVYASNPVRFKEIRNLVPMSEEQANVYKNPNNDPRGRWRAVPITAQAGHATAEQFYEIQAPGGKIHTPPKGRCWALSKKTFENLLADGRIYFGKDNNSQPNKIRYLSEVPGVAPWTWWPNNEVGHTDEAKKEMLKILGDITLFDTPKPVRLLERVIHIATNKNSIILDSFAGSGTTAHAVLNMNKKDGGERKFILIELMDYADSVTAERTKRVIDGYHSSGEVTEILYDEEITLSHLEKGADNIIHEALEVAEAESENYDKVSKPKIVEGHLRVIGTKFASEKVEGTGGDFTYYELGELLLKKDRTLNEEVPLETIRQYIWHTETHTPYVKPENENPAYLGEFNHTAYYFHYEKDEKTSLDYDLLAGVNIKADSYVIYADTCLLSSEELMAYNITFKKIPRDITKI